MFTGRYNAEYNRTVFPKSIFVMPIIHREDYSKMFTVPVPVSSKLSRGAQHTGYCGIGEIFGNYPMGEMQLNKCLASGTESTALTQGDYNQWDGFFHIALFFFTS